MTFQAGSRIQSPKMVFSQALKIKFRKRFQSNSISTCLWWGDKLDTGQFLYPPLIIWGPKCPKLEVNPALISMQEMTSKNKNWQVPWSHHYKWFLKQPFSKMSPTLQSSKIIQVLSNTIHIRGKKQNYKEHTGPFFNMAR